MKKKGYEAKGVDGAGRNARIGEPLRNCAGVWGGTDGAAAADAVGPYSEFN